MHDDAAMLREHFAGLQRKVNALIRAAERVCDTDAALDAPDLTEMEFGIRWDRRAKAIAALRVVLTLSVRKPRRTRRR